MKLTIDIGNSRTKFGLFGDDNVLMHYIAVLEGDEQEAIQTIFDQFHIESILSCTVANRQEEIHDLLRQQGAQPKKLSDLEIGMDIHYDTPETLGEDRIVAACGAEFLFPSRSKLVLDAGTCLTYEFIDDQGNYLGGAISPGVRMRFEALNNYTDRLPLLDTQKEFPLIGKSTKMSIVSGVQNGILNEVRGIIQLYQADYENLTVICTGGDTDFFVKGIKSDIFASPNLILIGLNAIIERNK
ncbi:MAG: type III pantothenate kinase [Flavobacteriales bacterium]|nr:type III pantothenate kinase [Flavobacteriales bacterium]